MPLGAACGGRGVRLARHAAGAAAGCGGRGVRLARRAVGAACGGRSVRRGARRAVGAACGERGRSLHVFSSKDADGGRRPPVCSCTHTALYAWAYLHLAHSHATVGWHLHPPWTAAPRATCARSPVNLAAHGASNPTPEPQTQPWSFPLPTSHFPIASSGIVEE